MESIKSPKMVLKGKYLVNIHRQNWKDKLLWDMKIETTLDLIFFITGASARVSRSLECETFQSFTTKGT
jgi:hypothetical protein